MTRLNCSIHGKPLNHAVKGPNCVHDPFELSAFKKFFAFKEPWEHEFCPVCGDQKSCESNLIRCDPSTGNQIEQKTSSGHIVTLIPASPIKNSLRKHKEGNESRQNRAKRSRSDSFSQKQKAVANKGCWTVDAVGAPKKLPRLTKSRGRVIQDKHTFCKFCNCEYGIGNTEAHQQGKRHIQKMVKRERWLLRRQDQAVKSNIHSNSSVLAK